MVVLLRAAGSEALRRQPLEDAVEAEVLIQQTSDLYDVLVRLDRAVIAPVVEGDQVNLRPEIRPVRLRDIASASPESPRQRLLQVGLETADCSETSLDHLRTDKTLTDFDMKHSSIYIVQDEEADELRPHSLVMWARRDPVSVAFVASAGWSRPPSPELLRPSFGADEAESETAPRKLPAIE